MSVLRAAVLCVVVLVAGVMPASGGVHPASATSPGVHIPAWAHPKTRENSLYMPDRLIVKMKDDPASATGKADPRRAFGALFQARSPERMFPSARPVTGKTPADISGLYVVRYDAPIDPFTVASEVSGMPGVEYAEPWFIYPLSDASSYTPNDSSFNLQWYLKSVYADSGWGIEKNDSTVVIGFVDTGVQIDHPDLAANLWINPGEDGPDGHGGDKRTNGIDDDGNGKIDDWRGWDFGGADYNAPVEDNLPVPTANNNAHGTHVAGIACAVTDNHTGIAGTSFNAKFLPVKATSDNDTRSGGQPYIIAGYQGIVYAAEMGADVISLSWGGSGYSQAEQDIIDYVTSLGSLVVAAAGNTGSSAELQYPASYDNVVSVAATQINADLKATYSSYNERVDVCTPGGQGPGSTGIYSTYYPGTYAYATGTSMATPIAAGVAALIRAHFPSYTPGQAGEQLRVTCDDIYTANATYKYKLGKGRVNAYRALTESWPSVRMVSYAASDSAGGNDNGAFEVNEDIDIAVDFTNFLLPTSSSTTITLASTSAYVTVTSGVFLPGAIPTGGSVNNDAAPFRVHVQPGIAPLSVVYFTLEISDGAYLDRQQFTLLFNPTFATHTVNDVQVTLTNNGRIGFQDFPSNTQGIGFIFGGANQLFEGGLILGTSPTKLENVVRNASGVQDNDFTSTLTYGIGPGPVADEQGSTYFSDSLASPTIRLGVGVLMESYAYASAPDNEYVITTYALKNVSGGQISGLYAGVFLDWDVHAASPLINPDSYFDSNRTAFDASRSLAYVWYDTTGPTTYCGIVALDTAASYRALFNSLSIDLSDAAKWDWISGGIVSDTGKGDAHAVLSSGPYTIESGLARKVAFALVAGNSLASLQSNADAAIAKWAAIRTLTGIAEEPPAGIPTVFSLDQNYPNPFNPSTTIRYGLPASGTVRLTIYSILGEEVRSLIAGEERGAGYHDVVWDGLDNQGRGSASGVYLYRMDYADAERHAFSETRKFILLR
jgi:serine protease